MVDLQGNIGAPGFEPGTSPTRITRGPTLSTHENPCKSGRITSGSPAYLGSSDFAGGFRAIGHTKSRCVPNRRPASSVGRDARQRCLDGSLDAAVRAAAQRPE